MSIKVYRNTGFMGSAANLKLRINGDRIEKIKPQEVLTIQIPREQVTFGIKLFLEKKKEIIVKNGDEIDIVYKKYFHYYFWTIMSLIVILVPLLEGAFRWGTAATLVLISFAIQYVYGTYDLFVNGEQKT
ncbi:hypothetical protein [Marinilactibacillus sp. Marseille-P9653]|uniref:hypothetical protein n=1 Tax=Marinilactibacillus sp. Marseille-P9653 TaxID=2866583 RepID=UPI001CE482AC|nr:hypothetical protein [Marinilactibacillus sp. Marseille-P9653]